MSELNSYELSRAWFDFCFANPEKIRPIHSTIYFFAIEHCNRLGWKEKFGFPSQMVMEAVGIKNWRTYSKALSELVDFGFIKMIEKSKNQYSSNIIAIVNNTKANTKALDKALQKHSQKQHTKQGQSIVSIIKQINNKQYNKEQVTKLKLCCDEFLNPENKIDNEVKFNIFWDSYHSITDLTKTDKEPALKHWNKLNKSEQQKAQDNIKAYFNSLDNKKYCKKARTYLSAKAFNDEFKNNEQSNICDTLPNQL